MAILLTLIGLGIALWLCVRHPWIPATALVLIFIKVTPREDLIVMFTLSFSVVLWQFIWELRREIAYLTGFAFGIALRVLRSRRGPTA